MDARTFWTIIVAIIIIGGGWYILSRGPNSPAPPASTIVDQTIGNIGSSTTATSTSNTVTLTNQGFSPQTLNVANGTTVTFINQSSSQMWIASAPHPTHQAYDGTMEAQHCSPTYTGPAPFDECATGNTFTFKFTKPGSWKFHNHTTPTIFGTIVVASSTTP